jgi:glutathione S-transferase
MRATLYGIPMSHPVITARLALARKGVTYDERTLLAGAHPVLLAVAGFRPTTVPALRLDGQRAQGSLAITRALDAAIPDPPLFPRDPGARAAVEEAEAWGERELQPVSRRLIRRSLVLSHAQRRWFAETAMPLPAPGVVAVALAPTARIFARLAGADTQSTRADLAAVEGLMDRVDALLAAGTIGGEQLNAADCQIAPSVRMLLAFADLREQIEQHVTAAGWARTLVPDYPDIPAALARN